MLLQEQIPQGSLYDLIDICRRVPDEIILIEIFSQITDAMTYLATYRMIYKDLSCKNISVFRFSQYKPKDNLVKLAGFWSLSKTFYSNTLCSTRNFWKYTIFGKVRRLFDGRNYVGSLFTRQKTMV